MKNKEFTVAELEDSINRRLEPLAGMAYTDGLVDVERLCLDNILSEFAERGIEELAFSNDRRHIEARMTEQGVNFHCDNVALIRFEVKQDKRIKYGGGRGKVLSAKVTFSGELLPLTLANVRRQLLEKSREEMLDRLSGIRDEAMNTVREMDAELERLKGIQF